MNASTPQPDCEYLVVGSGAGGGTVAARLAEAGHSVILLEAGGDPRALSGGDAVNPTTNRLPADYDVPCFHAFASENEAMRWNFFVRHYANNDQQQLDPSYRANYEGKPVDGVLYPRAGTLGGCTAHNAMIFVYPHDDDWNSIAALTKDPSWRSENMRRYFERLEDCHHRWPYRWLARLGINPSRHGFGGWLSTEKAVPMLSLRNLDLFRTLGCAAIEAAREIGHLPQRARWLVESMLDPNDGRTDHANSFGIRYLPLTTRRHRRNGSRERVLAVREAPKSKLRLELNALATRVLFDEGGRAIGVEYLSGERLYRAHSAPSEAAGEVRRLYASREVILAGGAFNTPQLLMLSGIGPREELEAHGIELRVDLPGVGRNLQDRYEISVVYRMNFPRWHVFDKATFDTHDPQYAQWQRGEGPYITNASVLAMFKRSDPNRPLPDLFCVAFLGKFNGYFPGYSKEFTTEQNYLSWAVLKAHTDNRAGRVNLRSADPRDTPRVDFSYFEEGTPDNDSDLAAVVDGLRFVRKVNQPLLDQGLIAEEELPGKDMRSETDLRSYIRNRAWGHHASCSCAMGPREQGGVLDSSFRVYGVSGLRVVDASVFPRIPGFFLACPTYMVGEKAADVILSEARVNRT